MIHLITPDTQGGVNDFTSLLVQKLGTNVGNLVYVSDKFLDVKISREDSIFLQFSGYGFQKRGAPLWLLSECQRLRETTCTFGIFFHELYASGPLWSSAFWLSPVQRHITRKLANICDFWVTSREGSGVWLRQYADHKPHAVLPVFSTIGEAKDLAAVRQPNVIIFGNCGLRQTTYRAAGNNLFKWARQQNLQVHDIGTPINDTVISRSLETNNVIQHGRLSAQEVCNMLSEAQFGIVSYPIKFVAKSSVFAAYCAHGTCPILISDQHSRSDGLAAGEHYLPAFPDKPVEESEISRISNAAWNWYQPHSLEMHTQTLLSLINSVNTS